MGKVQKKVKKTNNSAFLATHVYIYMKLTLFFYAPSPYEKVSNSAVQNCANSYQEDHETSHDLIFLEPVASSFHHGHSLCEVFWIWNIKSPSSLCL